MDYSVHHSVSQALIKVGKDSVVIPDDDWINNPLIYNMGYMFGVYVGYVSPGVGAWILMFHLPSCEFVRARWAGILIFIDVAPHQDWVEFY